jgi:dihydrolipoamide dehydrogenase
MAKEDKKIEQKKFDLCVIGAGPGGYVAAIRASQLGLKVGIVEANHLGGICLNWGCIPTKALLKSSEVNHLLHNLESFGFSAENVKFDFTKVIERSRAVSKKLSSGIASLMKKNKIEVVDGFAKFLDSKKISVSQDGKEVAQIEAAYFIIATGARARVIAGMEPDGESIWTYREAMTPKALPKSILVVGSGAIGSEFASFYRNMGTDVTLIEMAENILPVEDEEISKLARKSFEKQGIKVITSAALKSLKKGKDSVTAIVEVGGKTEEFIAEKVIMAVGVVANIENIGIEKTKVKIEKNCIKVSSYLETDDANIFAIGDVVSSPWLAHKASHEGTIAAEKIAAKMNKYDAKKVHSIKIENIPGCTYSMPQIASVGLTEKKALALGKKIKVGRFPYMANGKAIAAGETEGLIKVIFDEKTGELLGAHLIGAEVTEMIQGYVIAKQAELTEEDLMQTIFAHPTMSEMMHEAVLDAYGKVIHF